MYGIIEWGHWLDDLSPRLVIADNPLALKRAAATEIDAVGGGLVVAEHLPDEDCGEADLDVWLALVGGRGGPTFTVVAQDDIVFGE